MTNVLVGGRKREDVLNDRLQRLNEKRLDEEVEVKPASYIHNGLEWMRQPIINEKADQTDLIQDWYRRMRFDEGQRLLKKLGYRYPTLQEALTLRIDEIEGKLPSGIKGLTDLMDSLESGYYLDNCVERFFNTLWIHTHPTVLRYDGMTNQYLLNQQLDKNKSREFQIELSLHAVVINSAEMPPDLVQYLFGRSFNELPDPLKMAGHIIPKQPDGIRPLALCRHSITSVAETIHYCWGVRNARLEPAADDPELHDKGLM